MIHSRITTNDPQATALRVMGAAARAAVDGPGAWTLRRWAGDLAAAAGPKDYRGQLRALYDGILKRWRYVMEPGEWVSGPTALVANVLGARRNKGPTCPSPERCDVEKTPWKLKGWGDCDDVAGLTAAGVLALGMTPYFRVATGPSGAHVSVTARTPRGELVELDPVGHPEHPFGWALSGPQVQVYHVDMNGQALAGGRFSGCFGNVELVDTPQPMFGTLRGWSVPAMGDLESFSDEATTPCMDCGSGRSFAIPAQVAFVNPEDARGPRYLAMSSTDLDWARRGVMLSGTPAVDQFGQLWQYSADHAGFIPNDPEGMGRIRFIDRLRNLGRRVVRVVRRVGRGIRKAVSGVLSSRLVQWIAGTFARVIGVPKAVTKRLMASAGQFLKEGGLIGLIRLLRKNPREALRMLARAGAAALRPGAFSRRMGALDEPLVYEINQGGGVAYAAPIGAFLALPGARSFGSLNVTPTPTPGNSYVVQAGRKCEGVEACDALIAACAAAGHEFVGTKFNGQGQPIAGKCKGEGDTLLGIAGKAFKVGAGSERIKYANWIALSPTNAAMRIPPKTDFEKKYFPGGVLKLIPGAQVWIPPAEGAEPPGPDPVPPGPVPVPPPAPPPDPQPGPVPLPPPSKPPICPPGSKWNGKECEGFGAPKPPPGPPPAPPPAPPPGPKPNPPPAPPPAPPPGPQPGPPPAPPPGPQPGHDDKGILGLLIPLALAML